MRHSDLLLFWMFAVLNLFKVVSPSTVPGHVVQQYLGYMGNGGEIFPHDICCLKP